MDSFLNRSSGQLEIRTGEEFIHFNLYVQSQFLEEAMEVFVDHLTEPIFKKKYYYKLVEEIE